jgi:hypothetical protein
MNLAIPLTFAGLGCPKAISLLKTCEGGGLSMSEALRLLRSHGIPAKPGCSPYVGHYGIEVTTRNRRLLARAGRLLF